MFTGIVQSVGRIEGLRRRGGGGELQVAWGGETPALELGESIAVNGVCLTVRDRTQAGFLADVSGETLRRSTLGRLRAGTAVNLERALRPTDRLGGHFVLGHVDGLGRVVRFTRGAQESTLEIEHVDDLARYLAEKGSVAVDGISLTLATVGKRSFQVAVIPHTEEGTNLSTLRAGAEVNLEVDVLARYVARVLEAGGPEGGSSILDLLHR